MVLFLPKFWSIIRLWKGVCIEKRRRRGENGRRYQLLVEGGIVMCIVFL